MSDAELHIAGLELLLAAIHANDPKREILVRAGDAIREAKALSTWRPIATAPKDGTPIIGAFFSIRWADSHKRDDVVRCWWQPEFEAFISSCREMALHNGYTFGDGTTRQLHSPQVEPVTHWMPIPIPPKDTP